MANQRRVAVIGAGASGLAAIKCCLDEGIDVVCFERTDHISGLWHYTEQVHNGQACVMKSTVINAAKEMMCYSDFPIPKEYAIFMHNKAVDEYFHLYVDAFGLRSKISFETEVLSVTQAEDFTDTGRWNIVTSKDGNKIEHVFDAVLVCTGHHAEINMPTFPGMGEFQNQIIHSHDFRDGVRFQDKRVVVIGIGNSGGDIATELSRLGSQVYLSTRSGMWVFSRIGESGNPSQMSNARRYKVFIGSLFPNYFRAQLQKKVNDKFDHKKYKLEPSVPIFCQHPTVNDDLPNRIATGTIEIKPNVTKFTRTGVQFTDGTEADDIDLVVMATGYVFGFPFLETVVKVKNNEVKLYKYMFPPNQEKNTLAIIGCVQPLGAVMPISEMQSRLAARVFKGDVVLPDTEQMNADIERKRVAMAMRYQKSLRHTIQVDFIKYMDELASIHGCKPNLIKLFFWDPKLALECFFGPCTPYQYRLMGHGAWQGAREAIMTTWHRTYYPLNKDFLQIEDSRRRKKNEQRMVKYLTVAIVGLIVTAVVKTDAKDVVYSRCKDLSNRAWNLASQLRLKL